MRNRTRALQKWNAAARQYCHYVSMRPPYCVTLPMRASDAAAEAATETCDDDDCGVQDILAARTTVAGGLEFLTLWKPRWVHECSFAASNPVKRRWDDAVKWASCDDCDNNSAMQVILPVPPGSEMAEDIATVAAVHAQKARPRRTAAARRASDADSPITARRGQAAPAEEQPSAACRGRNALCSNCGKRPIAPVTLCFDDWCEQCDSSLWDSRDL